MSTRHRSEETEIMDDFALEGAELLEALDKIARINQVLGGNKLTIDAVAALLSTRPKDTHIRIMDLGCGNGDMLRALSTMAQREKRYISLKGIDANAFTIQHAKALSESYQGITYECADILSPDFALEQCDIILFTLTLHHFTDEQIVQLLTMAAKKATLAIVINDLQRSKCSYLLFTWMSKILRLGRMNSIDGKLSILRGFKRKDLVRFARKMNFKSYTIRWKWAFRYQWIISDL